MCKLCKSEKHLIGCPETIDGEDRQRAVLEFSAGRKAAARGSVVGKMDELSSSYLAGWTTGVFDRKVA